MVFVCSCVAIDIGHIDSRLSSLERTLPVRVIRITPLLALPR